jgi:hypothetical protein
MYEYMNEIRTVFIWTVPTPIGGRLTPVTLDRSYMLCYYTMRNRLFKEKINASHNS